MTDIIRHKGIVHEKLYLHLNNHKLKVLIVCGGNNRENISPFVMEQGKALQNKGIEIDYFPIKGKGPWGYLKNHKRLKHCIKTYNYDLIHAHYGLSGLLATLQRIVPVIITFHGSDINQTKLRPFSRLADYRASSSIFVSNILLKAIRSKNAYIIPCGVDMRLFKPGSKKDARADFGLNDARTNILFSSAFDNKVKNYSLAKKTVELLKNNLDAELIELAGFTREETATMMRAADCLLMTSFHEGSPQVIKEAMACRLPIVSTQVGDVIEHKQYYPGLTICPYNENILADAILKTINEGNIMPDNDYINLFDNNIIVERIIEVYKQVLRNNSNE